MFHILQVSYPAGPWFHTQNSTIDIFCSIIIKAWIVAMKLSFLGWSPGTLWRGQSFLESWPLHLGRWDLSSLQNLVYFSKIFLEQGTNNKAEGYSWFEYAETKCRTKNHREKFIVPKNYPFLVFPLLLACDMLCRNHRYYQQIAGGTGNNYTEIQILIYWRLNRSMHKNHQDT